ncbi:MAG: hypothetical protein RMA76_00305 [Deltaproteobacteria bacterium]|jgi:hypothetical protein
MTTLAPHTHYHRRRMEEALSVFALSQSLHDRVVSRAEPDVGSALRIAVADDAILSALAEGTRRSLFKTVAKVKDRAAHRGLLALCREPGFGHLTSNQQRRLLESLPTNALSARLIADLTSILRAEHLASASHRLREVVIAEFQRVAETPNARRDLAVVFNLEAFAVMRTEEQVDLLRYVAGPNLAANAAPMRRQRIQLFWNGRRSALLRLTRDRRFASMPAAAQANHLRDFLHGRGLELYFLDATHVNGHGALVFGSPSDPKSLSYGRRWVVAKHNKPVAKLYNPDPSVRSKWQTPKGAEDTKYAFCAYKISRHLELTLIDHIERAYVVSDDLRITGRALGVQARAFVRQAEFVTEITELLEQLAAHSGGIERRDGYLQGGKENVTEEAPKAANDLLQQFLSA